MDQAKFRLSTQPIQENDQNQHQTHICVDWGVFYIDNIVKISLLDVAGGHSVSVNMQVSHPDTVELCVWCDEKYNSLPSGMFPYCSLNQKGAFDK